ncbi:hypothetical protein M3231_05485 [Neobacillus mesonae]|nr:hypothetical protein [Neobacillus mesonae]
MRFRICLFLFLLVLTGCLNGNEETIVPEIPEPIGLVLTPIDLSQGESAKFRPFLGMMSGSFKLEYKGSKPNARLDMDIWENGRRVDTNGSIGDLFFDSGEQKSDEIELIISVDTVHIEEQREMNIIKINRVSDSGTSLSTFSFPWNKELTTRGLIETMEPLSFTADQAVHVFGVQATSTNSIRTADLSEESLSQTEWALIFTLRFDEPTE